MRHRTHQIGRPANFDEIHNNYDATREPMVPATDAAVQRARDAHQAFARGEIKTVAALIDAMTGFGEKVP